MKQTLKKTTLAYGGLLVLGMSTGPALAEWQWSTVRDLGDAPAEESAFPQVAVEPNSGMATTAWKYITSYPAARVLAARYSDGVWQPASTISPDEAIYLSAPKVALDKKGNASVSWTAKNPSNDLWRLSSATWNKPQSIWRETPYDLGSKTIDATNVNLVKAKNGVATAIWEERLVDGSYVLRASQLKNNNRWTPAKTITQGAGFLGVGLSIGSNGVITAVWSQETLAGYRIKSAQFKNGGWKAIRDVSTAGIYDDTVPDVTTDGKGRVTVVWERKKGGDQPKEILASQLKQGKWSDEKIIGSAGRGWGSPRIASDKKARITAVWNFTNPEGSAVFGYVKTSQLTGNSDWTEPTVVGPFMHSIYQPSQLAMDAQGNATVAWEFLENSTRKILASHQSSGNWGQPIELCTTCYAPSIGADNLGNVIAVWQVSGKIQTRRGSDQH